ncbi:MAG: SMR family transporter [Pseudomonadota bacterium]
MPFHYVYLFFAILAETVGTTALQASQQFTRPLPTILVVVAYGASFYLMSITLKFMPVGIVYAIWSGLGIVFIAAIGFAVFGQRLDFPAVAGIALIVAGILVIHLFSTTSSH